MSRPRVGGVNPPPGAPEGRRRREVAMTALWLLFAGLAGALIALDVWLARRATAARARADLALFLATLAAVVAFAAAAWQHAGGEAALAFLSAWVLEEALSVDNLFVFMLIFRHFAVPPQMMGRVLRWGIVGAVLLRGAFIVAGLALVERLDGVLYAFGALLMVSGLKVLAAFRQSAREREAPAMTRWLGRFLPLSSTTRGDRFFVREGGGLRATPALAALLAVELSDVVFAVDSVPAVLSITRDPLSVAASNLFAILSLRSLFRLLGHAAGHLRFLELGLAGILLFIGAKMLLHRVVDVGIGASLAAVVTMLGGAVVASLWWPRASAPVA